MVSGSLWPPWTIPWNPPNQNTGEDSLSLLQRIFLTQELNQGLLHCTWTVYQLSYQGIPDKCRQHIKRQKYYLPTKVCRVNAMIFPVVMYGCESCTVKKAEHWRINTFELSCWMRLLKVPDNACRSNHSILKEIDPEYSLEGLMLRLQYFGHLESWLIRKDHDAGKDWGQKKGMTEDEMTEDKMVGWHRSVDTSLNKLWDMVKVREAWGAAVHGSQRVGCNWATEQQLLLSSWVYVD